MSIQVRNLQEQDIPFLTPYVPRKRVFLSFPDDSEFTKQEFKDECDINVIMAQYQHTGIIPNLNERTPAYQDCTGHDYQMHMNKIIEAQELFNDLPSKVRDRFANDPAAFLDFVHDEKNLGEMKEMGLLRPVADVIPEPKDFVQEDLPLG